MVREKDCAYHVFIYVGLNIVHKFYCNHEGDIYRMAEKEASLLGIKDYSVDYKEI